jgi:PilZ domain
MAEHMIPCLNGKVRRRPERRAWVRFACSQEACCQPISAFTADESQTGWLGRLRDISVSSLALRMNLFFAPGRLLTIELNVHREARSFPAQVVYAAPERRVRPLTQEELRTFIGR